MIPLGAMPRVKYFRTEDIDFANEVDFCELFVMFSRAIEAVLLRDFSF